jgi:hypothetical protein
MRPMELLTTPAARAAFTPRQLSYALEVYAANGPSLDYGNGRVAALYEFPEGLLTIVEEGRQLALRTAEDAFRAHDACAVAEEKGVSGDELG